MHKQGKGYTKWQRHNVSRDTVESIVCKFKVKVTLATLPGHGRKRKLSVSATRFLRRQVVRNPPVIAKDLQQDLMAAVTEVSVYTVRHVVHAEGLNAQIPRRSPLLTQKHKKSQFQYAENHINKPQKFCNSVLWSDETKLELFGPVNQWYIWRRKNKAYTENNTLPTVKYNGGS